MYNRYVPNGAAYTRIPMEESGHHPGPSDESVPRQPPRRGSGGLNAGLFSSLLGDWEGSGGLLRALKLDRLDSGDILLLLIVLFLLVEGDNLELVIALGLVLILGLGDEET